MLKRLRGAVVVCLGIGVVVSMAGFAQSTAPGAVTEERVRAEADAGANWLVGGRTFEQQHFSPLKQITDQNVAGLGLAWSLDIDSAMGMAAEPIVVDGVIYVSAPFSRVYAMDAATGRVLWFVRPTVHIERIRNSALARTNRGVAVWGGKVYVGTGDCRLLAMDAKTGKQLWDVPACDGRQTGITAAPTVGAGKVYIGYNGSDSGARGSIAAFDAESGKEVWRFWTVPGDPAKGFESKALEMAAKTWSGENWWELGGGAVWNPITYDAVTGLVFMGTSGASAGNYRGDRSGMKVSGEKLYSGSIVAVRADTGEYVWHYQTRTADHDTDNEHIVVADLALRGERQRVVMTVPKNGFFYVLDARTGRLFSGQPVAKVAWANAIDAATSRPVKVASAPIGRRDWTVHNWWPMSYSPITGLAYIPITDERSREPAPGETPLGGKLLAWDPIRQAPRWGVEMPMAVNSGVLSTAGNLVFAGEGTGKFAAYAADSGRELWSIKTGSAINSTPVSFSVRGEQYVAVPVGWGSFSRMFGAASMMATPESKRGPSRLLAFKLGAKTPFPATPVVVPSVPRPPDQTYDRATIERGQTLYNKFFCVNCHSPQADGSGARVLEGAVPDLRYLPSFVHGQWNAIVLDGTRRAQGMPGFRTPPGFPLEKMTMTEAEAEAIHAYVIEQSWKAYNEEQARGTRR
jgi:PQQ-dependent dehydrogenase (methanol/ethanol family)